MDRGLKNDLACIFKYFGSAYAQRWEEQKLTGNIVMTINFAQGSIRNANFQDKETKYIEELRDIARLSKY